METPTAKIGIIGGSGFYQFLEGKEFAIDTSFGKPSDKVLVSQYQGKSIAFLPRHGRSHQLPPHKINYRANLFALKKLGVQQILAPCAVGSLRPEIEPGHFVVVDQFINKTSQRRDTFFDGPDVFEEPFRRVAHIAMAEPYCSGLRDLIIQSCQKLNIPHHKQGTVVVIEGPRFSTKSESDFYARFADVINMTQYPEVALARELEMCYANISVVTDYDAGLQGRGDVKSVTAQEVLKKFQENTAKLKQLILEVIKNMPDPAVCPCQEALKDALV